MQFWSLIRRSCSTVTTSPLIIFFLQKAACDSSATRSFKSTQEKHERYLCRSAVRQFCQFLLLLLLIKKLEKLFSYWNYFFPHCRKKYKLNQVTKIIFHTGRHMPCFDPQQVPAAKVQICPQIQQQIWYLSLMFARPTEKKQKSRNSVYCIQ